jgi:glycosyltransferase involved in cell wall biosynthesis
VRHIGASGGDRVERLPDEREPGQRGWWPPRMLEPEWVVANAERFDLFHVQFGYDGRHPDQLRELTALLGELGKPIVYTVHDLRNPNHESHLLHEEQLAVVIGAADALLTLTDGARRQIAARFGAAAEVVPHPHVVPLELLEGRYAGPRPVPAVPRVGVHFKSLRANMVGVALLEALAPGGAVPAAGPLRVDVHDEIWDPAAPAFRGDLRCSLEYLERGGAVDLRRHGYFSDLELYDYLRSLDVAILPYRFGTHSGWLEACRDLGTAVVAPSCGCYADQGPVFEYRCDEEGLDAESLRHAVAGAVAAVRAGQVHPVGAAARRAQRLAIAAAHERVYDRVLTEAEGRGRAARPASGVERHSGATVGSLTA